MGQRGLLGIIAVLVIIIAGMGGALGQRYIFAPAAAGKPLIATPTNAPTVTSASTPSLTDTAAPEPTRTPVQTSTPRPAVTVTSRPRATQTPQRRPSAAPVSQASADHPGSVIKSYYAAVNAHAYALAYRDVMGAFVTSTTEATFARGYADTASVDLGQVVPASYRLLTDNGLTLTCVGFQIITHSTTGPSATYGGWYKVLHRGSSPWAMDLALSHSQLGQPATVPSAHRCGRGLNVVGTAPGEPRNMRPSAGAPTATPQTAVVTEPTLTPTSIPVTPGEPTVPGLINVTGSGNEKTKTFTASGAFTISWDGRLADPSNTANLFSINLHYDGGYTDLADNEANASTVHGSKVEQVTCASGCYLEVESDNTHYNVIVQDNASGKVVAHLPPESTRPVAVDVSDPIVQDLLHFDPACTSVQVNGTTIADRIEGQEGFDSYIGSSDVPGAFTKARGAHGSHIITWTLPHHQLYGVYEFNLSEDGSTITYLNDATSSIGCGS